MLVLTFKSKGQMAMACKQHHLLLGLGAQSTHNYKRDLTPFLLPFNNRARISPSKLACCAAVGEPGPNKQSHPLQQRRRGQIPPEWEDLTIPDPEPPNYLLWAAGFSLAYLTRGAIVAELIEWASIVAVLGLTFIRLSRDLIVTLLLKAVHLAKGPITLVLTLAGWTGLFTRDAYTVIVNTTSVWPTTKALLLVSLVLSLGEATRPNAVSGQPWSFTLATLLAVGAVSGVIHHTVYVLLLVLLTCFSVIVQKKEVMTAVMPAVAVLVGIAELPLKVVAFAVFLAIAVYTHWKTPKEDVESVSNKRTVQPLIMVVAAFFVGLTIGARYLRAWQALWLAKG